MPRVKQDFAFHCIFFPLICLSVSWVPSAGAQIAVPPMEFAHVSDESVQPGGPAHGFLIGRFEVRNDQFVEFLNDAKAHLDDERGQFLYFDTDSGDVFLNTTPTGTIGTGGSGTFLFRNSVNPYVSYNGTLGRYETATGKPAGRGFEDHPVTGVSWYGALKYCNWLTLHLGQGIDARAYAEAPAPILSAWRPVTISASNWAVRDLNATERTNLLRVRGFRLPMDGGDGDGEAGTFNEWYKAAAWDHAAAQNRVYGFGRDTIGTADANYRCSLDPFEDSSDCLVGGTTPVGFYDGSLQFGTFQTRPGANPYGLFDLSGNVWEWMQDQSFDPADRRNRGGSFRSGVNSLAVDLSAEREADSANDSTGFRVVLVQEVVGQLAIIPEASLIAAGPWGGPYDLGTSQKTYRIHNVGLAPASFTVAKDADWLTLQSPPTLSLAAGASTPFAVSVGPRCDDGLTVGEHSAHVFVNNSQDGSTIRRTVHLTVTEPLELSPSDTFSATVPFGGSLSPLQQTLTLTNHSSRPVQWSMRVVDVTDAETPVEPAAWLTIGGGSSLSGEVPALAQENIVAAFVPDAVNQLSVGEYRAEIILSDECTSGTIVRVVHLSVQAPFAVTPIDEAVSRGVCGGPFPAVSWTLRNTGSVPLNWLIDSDRSDLVILSPRGGTVAVFGQTVVTARVSEVADSLPIGRHVITLGFGQPTTGFFMLRTMVIEVSAVIVEPDTSITFRGPRAGPFEPSQATLRLFNTGVTEFEWSARFDDTTNPPSGETWLEFSEDHGTILNPEGFADIMMSPSPAATRLPPGTYNGLVTFTHDSAPGGCPTQRNVTLTVGREAFSLPMAVVPAEDAQSNGPVHRYRIGTFEVTNTEFTRFLNETHENPDSEFARFVDHGSPPAGLVRLSGDETVLFDSAQGGAIEFVDRYEIAAGKENHPVVGVSWYGAAKFCNWMTLVQGMDDPDQRAYHEGPRREDWYAVSPDPAAWIATTRGFRLPMDGGTTGASLYNEWYKAASRLGENAAGEALFGALYGFGRSTLGPQDANYSDNGDTLTDGPTPVGFFNGVNRLAIGSALTRNTANGYEIHDMCGNVAEWVHDGGAGDTERAIRGGHFNSASNSQFLKTTVRNSLPGDQGFSFVGFRVAQTLDAIPLVVGQISAKATGFAGGPVSPERLTLFIENAAPFAQDAVSLEINSDWLEVDGVAPRLVPPHDTLEIPLRFRVSGESPGLSPPPSGDLVLVPGSDTQHPDETDPANGPDYDFWIGRFEVRNQDFAEFLNDALTNIRGEPPAQRDGRSDHMFFDLDSGNVYLHDQRTGEEGADAPTASVFVRLYDAAVGKIRYAKGRYEILEGFDDHPVVGVTWFGAVKFCNWFSLIQGIPAELLAYSEAPSPDLDGWRPTGDPNFDRRRWVTETIGYRLPMDDESPGPSPFNEWHKAAAWDSISLAEGQNHLYGFGRELLTNSDANFHDSSDLETDGTTPVGFFDGQRSLFQEPHVCYPISTALVSTANTANAYGLYDLCGNVAEWSYDLGDIPQHRATRGGSWRDPIASSSLTNEGRNSRRANGAYADVGFRIVRGTGHIARVTVHDTLHDGVHRGYFALDLQEPLHLEPKTDTQRRMRYGDSQSQLEDLSYTLTNPSATAMPWRIEITQSWLDGFEVLSEEAEGLLAAGGSIDLRVTTNPRADLLPPGTHQATITIENAFTGRRQSRSFELHIDPPLRIEPAQADPQVFDGLYGGPFSGPSSQSFAIRSEVNFPLHYDITTEADWLELEALDGLNGTLPGSGSRNFLVRMNDAADQFDVGDYPQTIHITYNDPRNPQGNSELSQPILLRVQDPVSIHQSQEPWQIGPGVEAGALPTQDYSISIAGDAPMDVSVQTDQPWLVVTPTFAKIVPDQPALFRVRIMDSALALPNGDYEGTIFFENGRTGAIQCRHVALDIEEELSVEPFEDFFAVAISGRGVAPRLNHYRLTNSTADTPANLQWSAQVSTPNVDWILLNGAAATGGQLAPGESASLVAEIDADRAALLPPGDYEALIDIVDGTHSESVTRGVRLSVVEPHFDISESALGTVPRQPGGPSYPCRMGTHLVTNAEFATFLNDALSHPDDERGAYLYFDSTTGGVYINSQEQGQIGVGLGARTVKMFSPSLTGQIVFAKGTYRAATSPTDFSHHPIAGVSWYGALKYCNWLTIDQGMLPSERCYAEATDADISAWHPVSISTANWAARELTDAEREILTRDYRGYRLPMDDGAFNTTPAGDAPDAYNEWYLAAAWNPMLNPPRDTLYGFGRDALTVVDANFRGSGDAFDNGSTPVDYYVAANGNAFGIQDMTGNVYQWMQDRFSTHPGNLGFRALRGGSWNDPIEAASLRVASRSFTRPERVDGQIGFRVVRTLPEPTGDLDLDGDIDSADLAEFSLGLTGPAGRVFPAWSAFDFDADGDVDLMDLAEFQRIFTGEF